MTFKTTKILPGLYRVSVKGTSRTVTIDHVTKAEGLDFDGWMVRADWNQSLCGEVCRTKAEAIEEARHLFDGGKAVPKRFLTEFARRVAAIS